MRVTNTDLTYIAVLAAGRADGATPADTAPTPPRLEALGSYRGPVGEAIRTLGANIAPRADHDLVRGRPGASSSCSVGWSRDACPAAFMGVR